MLFRSKPKRRNPRHRHRDQVYWVYDNTFSYDGKLTTWLLYDNKVLEIDGIENMGEVDGPEGEENLWECWAEHRRLANKPGEGVRLREVTTKEARRLWQGRLCSDTSNDDYDE